MDTVYDQALLDTIFNDLDVLLAAERPSMDKHDSCCYSCGRSKLIYSGANSSHPGSRVCESCGVVQSGCVFFETMYGKTISHRGSNYKRIHHWHERISQLLLMESQIPPRKMLLIAERICDGTYTILNKDTIRTVLRSLKLQHYIEKWLQIVFRITKVAPPMPGSSLINKLDDMFLQLQEPFECYRLVERKNFLNYNYVFCRLFQRLHCEQFCMFFPLIKSKQKLKVLDDMWETMVRPFGWDTTPMEPMAPFAVRLEKPDSLLSQLKIECDALVQAEPQIEPLKMVYRTLDHRSINKMLRDSKRRHSDPPEPKSRRAVGVAKRYRCI